MKAAGSTASRRPSTHPRATILVTMKFSDRRSHVTRVVGLPNRCAFPIPLLPQEVSRSIPRPFRGPACPPMNIFAVCVCVGVRTRMQAYEQAQTSFSGPSSASRLRVGRSYLCMHYVYKYHVSADYTTINQRFHRDPR